MSDGVSILGLVVWGSSEGTCDWAAPPTAAHVTLSSSHFKMNEGYPGQELQLSRDI
ncbi:uncharacterized protein FFMR_07573 [Fusarium fujikuroi]|nr:uncharacterized protein FFMR_07573 [Fusarium fujikuroi]